MALNSEVLIKRTRLAASQSTEDDKEINLNLLDEASNCNESSQCNTYTPEQFALKDDIDEGFNKKDSDRKRKVTYKKEQGTAGITGQLYESKILSLILFKLLHNDDFEEFYLGTNIFGICPFDDVCVRLKIKGKEKFVLLFIQLKHKDNPQKAGITTEDLHNTKSDFYFKKYSERYSDIKHKFQPDIDDAMFEGDFNDFHCVFVVYTSAVSKFGKTPTQLNDLDLYIHSLISTGQGKMFQINDELKLSKKKEDKSKLNANILNNGSSGDECSSGNNNLPENSLENELLNKFWFFTNQAKENLVETTLKNEIDQHLHNLKKENFCSLRFHTDAVYLFFHNYVQKWWMLQKKSYYLEKECDFFEKSKTDALENPLLSVLNFTCINKFKENGIEFNNEAVDALKLDQFNSGLLNVVTDVVMFSGIKLYQYFEHFTNNNYTFIDFDSVRLTLSANDFDVMLDELKKTKLNIFVIINKGTKKGYCNDLQHLICALDTKRIILITDEVSARDVGKYYFKSFDVMRDESTDFIDLTPEAQSKILKETNISFQGVDVTLDNLIDESSKHLIKANILFKLIKNERIEIGITVTNADYENKKEYYIRRLLRSGKVSYGIKTLQDLKDRPVIISATAGMGKSSFLTQLSIETKILYPKKWIARINLNDYSINFHQWQKNKTVIDINETLKLICTAAINGVIAGSNIQGKFDLEERNGEINLKNWNEISDSALLEIQLFIHLYNKGEVVFIFDGFDEICPYYEKQVVEVIKTLAVGNYPAKAAASTLKCATKKHNVWVSTRPYKDIMQTLDDEFTTSFTLEPLSRVEQKEFFKKFWKKNVKLHELSGEQFKNIDYFFDMMSLGFVNFVKQSSLCMLVPTMYAAAIEHFESEVKYTENEEIKYKWYIKYKLIKNNLVAYEKAYSSAQDTQIADVPLHMHILAEYFQSVIKDQHYFGTLDSEELMKKFDFSKLYELFIEIELKRMFIEKGFVDISKPVNKRIYEEEFEKVTKKHKKLAMYVSYHEDVKYLQKIISIEEINVMVASIQNGEEKTGIVTRIRNSVPVFVHDTFAEHLTVEFICDMLKSPSYDKREILWDFILRIVFFKSKPAVLYTFMHKMATDTELRAKCKEEFMIVFKVFFCSIWFMIILFKMCFGQWFRWDHTTDHLKSVLLVHHFTKAMFFIFDLK